MRLTRCLAAALAFALPFAAAAGPVVILSGEVNGNGPGSVVDEATVISLPAGAVLMMNDASGQTRTLTGPYDGPIGAAGNGAAEASGLERLVATRAAETSRLGAIRAAPGQIPPDAAMISIAQSAVQCAPADAAIRLWRPETMDADSHVTITDPASGAEAQMIWHQGVATVEWPAALPLVSGRAYLVEMDLVPRPVEITLHRPETEIADTAALAEWMTGKGCRRQALALLDRLSN